MPDDAYLAPSGFAQRVDSIKAASSLSQLLSVNARARNVATRRWREAAAEAS
jgi:hypothetical protein